MRLVTSSSILIAALIAAPAFVTPADAAAPTIENGVLASFDGTPIVYTFFLPDGASAAAPVPLVMMTHGWAGTRTATATGMVAELLDRGFAVLTWDSRGFGQSGGFIELDSPDFEVKDAIALLDEFGARPEIMKSGSDPWVGMVGGSYAGGIQLLTAAFDDRIDAIVPDITWNDLRYSLAPNGVPKIGWIEALFGAGAATGTALGMDPRNPAGPDPRSYNTNLPSWWATAHATNEMGADAEAGLAYRSISQYMDGVAAPVLITQGWPDTLFTPNEAITNFEALRGQGNDARLLLYCGGHAGCPYVSGDAIRRERTLAFLEEHLFGWPASVPTVEWQDNTGAWHTGQVWPPYNSQLASAEGALQLVSTPAPTGGGSFAVSAGGVNTGRLSAPVDDQGTGTGEIVIFEATAPTQVTGVGNVTLTVTGTGTEAFLFLRLVDITTGHVLGDQTQAIRLPVGSEFVLVDLVGVSYVVPTGHTLALQIATSDFAHATNREPGVYDIHAHVVVPIIG